MEFKFLSALVIANCLKVIFPAINFFARLLLLLLPRSVLEFYGMMKTKKRSIRSKKLCFWKQQAAIYVTTFFIFNCGAAGCDSLAWNFVFLNKKSNFFLLSIQFFLGKQHWFFFIVMSSIFLYKQIIVNNIFKSEILKINGKNTREHTVGSSM